MKFLNFPKYVSPTSRCVEARRLGTGRPAADAGAGAAGFPVDPAAGGAVKVQPCDAQGGPPCRRGQAGKTGFGSVPPRSAASGDATEGGVARWEIGPRRAGSGAVPPRIAVSEDATEGGVARRKIGPRKVEAGSPRPERARPGNGGRDAGGWRSAACRRAAGAGAEASAPEGQDGLAAGDAAKAKPLRRAGRRGPSCGGRASGEVGGRGVAPKSAASGRDAPGEDAQGEDASGKGASGEATAEGVGLREPGPGGAEAGSVLSGRKFPKRAFPKRAFPGRGFPKGAFPGQAFPGRALPGSGGRDTGRRGAGGRAARASEGRGRAGRGGESLPGGGALAARGGSR